MKSNDSQNDVEPCAHFREANISLRMSSGSRLYQHCFHTFTMHGPDGHGRFEHDSFRLAAIFDISLSLISFTLFHVRWHVVAVSSLRTQSQADLGVLSAGLVFLYNFPLFECGCCLLSDSSTQRLVGFPLKRQGDNKYNSEDVLFELSLGHAKGYVLPS